MARGDNVTVTPGINVRPDAGGLQGGEQQDQSSEIGGGLSASRPEDNQAQTGQSSSNNQAAVDESAAAAAAAAKEAERRRKEDEWRRRKEEIDRRREERKGRAKTFIPDAEVESEADLRGLDIYDPEVIAAVRKEMEEERFGPQVKEPEVTAHGLASEIADEFLPPVANSLEDGGEPVEQMLTQVPEGVVDNKPKDIIPSENATASAMLPFLEINSLSRTLHQIEEKTKTIVNTENKELEMEEGGKTLHCVECGGAVRGSWNYCLWCGSKVPGTYCSQCGERILKEWDYCPECREMISDDTDDACSCGSGSYAAGAYCAPLPATPVVPASSVYDEDIPF